MKTNFKFKTQLIAFAYVLLAVVFLIGCEKDKTKSEVIKQEVKQEFYGQNIEIVVIDSCEYLYVSNGKASWGAHKGNCKFCLTRHAK